jgi:hypothetical protein
MTDSMAGIGPAAYRPEERFGSRADHSFGPFHGRLALRSLVIE